MTLIPLPAKGIRNIDWTMPTVNGFVVKSGWSGYQTVGDPGGISDGFRAKVEIAPGRDERLPWHAFYTRLRGPVNTFRLPTKPQLACPVATLIMQGDGRTGNQLLHSNDFTQAAWTKNGGGIGSQAVPDPEGISPIALFVENVAAGAHGISQGFTSVVGRRMSFGISMRYTGGRRYIQLSADTAAANFDLVTGGVIFANVGTEARITAEDNGWWRLSITYTATVTSGNAQMLVGSGAGTYSYTGAGQSVGIWAAQFQAGPPSFYVPTGATGLQTLGAFVVTTPTPSTTYLLAGQHVTLANRLYTLASDLRSDGASIATVNVGPDLGVLPTTGQGIECQRPYAVMRNVTSELGWSEMLAGIDQPFAFNAEEVL